MTGNREQTPMRAAELAKLAERLKALVGRFKIRCAARGATHNSVTPEEGGISHVE